MSAEEKAEASLEELVKYKGGQRRDVQVRLARGLARHIDNGEPLLVEAPTGVGKSFSAIAAARASGEKTLISTHTHGLQQQLQKDAEMLSEATGGFKITVLKGRSAYLCKLKENQILQNKKDSPNSKNDENELDKVLEWAEDTEEGDKSELPFPVSSETWSQVSVSSDQCAGKQCPFFKSCFAELARAKAKESDITVLNHALVAQGMKQENFLDGKFPNLIVDEAHEFANVVGEAFGATITIGRLRWIAGKARKVATVESKEKFERAIDYIASYGKNLREPLRHIEGHAINRKIVDLLASVTQWGTGLDKSTSNKDYILKQTLFNLAMELELVAQGDTNSQTSWIEWRGEDDFTLRSVLFNPGWQIRANLLERHHSVSFMSATLKIGGSLNPIANRLGMNKMKWQGAQLPHMFDYEKNGLIWYPERLKSHTDPDHSKQVAMISKHAINAAQGRTLILCTSWKNVNIIGNKLREAFAKEDFPIIMQKPGVNIKRLAEDFIAQPNAVLIGTMSLWTGMSFEGNTCVSTIIDKIPFPSPADPVIAARLEQVEENGGNGFGSVLVPEASLRMKQGIGRTLRTPFDQGVITICDPRMNPNSKFYKSSYAKTIHNSFPPMPVTYDTKEALDRLAQIHADAETNS